MTAAVRKSSRAAAGSSSTRKQQVAERRRQRAPITAAGRRDHLFGEERIPFRALEDGIEQVLRRRGLEDRGQLIAYFGTREAFELDA